MMKILAACEESQRVCTAFRHLGQNNKNKQYIIGLKDKKTGKGYFR